MLSLQIKSGEYITIGENVVIQVFQRSGSVSYTHLFIYSNDHKFSQQPLFGHAFPKSRPFYNGVLGNLNLTFR